MKRRNNRNFDIIIKKIAKIDRLIQKLLVLSGKARFLWKHGIKAVKSDKLRSIVIPRSRRISVTFRKIKA